VLVQYAVFAHCDSLLRTDLRQIEARRLKSALDHYARMLQLESSRDTLNIQQFAESFSSFYPAHPDGTTKGASAQYVERS